MVLKLPLEPEFKPQLPSVYESLDGAFPECSVCGNTLVDDYSSAIRVVDCFCRVTMCMSCCDKIARIEGRTRFSPRCPTCRVAFTSRVQGSATIDRCYKEMCVACCTFIFPACRAVQVFPCMHYFHDCCLMIVCKIQAKPKTVREQICWFVAAREAFYCMCSITIDEVGMGERKCITYDPKLFAGN